MRGGPRGRSQLCIRHVFVTAAAGQLRGELLQWQAYHQDSSTKTARTTTAPIKTAPIKTARVLMQNISPLLP